MRQKDGKAYRHLDGADHTEWNHWAAASTRLTSVEMRLMKDVLSILVREVRARLYIDAVSAVLAETPVVTERQKN